MNIKTILIIVLVVATLATCEIVRRKLTLIDELQVEIHRLKHSVWDLQHMIQQMDGRKYGLLDEGHHPLKKMSDYEKQAREKAHEEDYAKILAREAEQ
jgi:hypothetical protein